MAVCAKVPITCEVIAGSSISMRKESCRTGIWQLRFSSLFGELYRAPIIARNPQVGAVVNRHLIDFLPLSCVTGLHLITSYQSRPGSHVVKNGT